MQRRNSELDEAIRDLQEQSPATSLESSAGVEAATALDPNNVQPDQASPSQQHQEDPALRIAKLEQKLTAIVRPLTRCSYHSLAH